VDLCATMAMEKQTTDCKEQDGESQARRTRGTLESDCAVVVPTSSAAVFHRYPSIGVIRQNIGFSDVETRAVVSDSEPTSNTNVVHSCLHAHTHCTVAISTIASIAFRLETVECKSTAGMTASSVDRKALESGFSMMQMEDEPDECGDT